ncbi:hypothetical protein [Phaeovulum veldkampii]|nr:hypothetical protein [Phaeovulum veldkampii]TDQ57054.1 hypothetical protein EV658_11413 [Phaeovulum veldkampii DSM 11550]
MGRMIKAVVYLAVLGAVGVVGYAYLGDMTATPADMRIPVVLNVTN